MDVGKTLLVKYLKNYEQSQLLSVTAIIAGHGYSCNCKCRFNSTTCNSNQKWNNDKYQWEFKKYCTCKKDSGLNPSTCVCENSKYLKHIVCDPVIICDEITYVMVNASTNMTNTISTNALNI